MQMTFEQYKQYKQKLESEVEFFRKALEEFPKNADVYESPEYQIAKFAYQVRCRELQRFVRVHLHRFKKELSKEAASKYLELAKGE